jgi:uncharacterized surface protein with fasciclin (FAS1) repeats
MTSTFAIANSPLLQPGYHHALASSCQAMADVMSWRCRHAADQGHIDNAVNSKDHTTLVAAVKAAGLVENVERSLPIPPCLHLPPLPPCSKLPVSTVVTSPGQRTKARHQHPTHHVVAGKVDAASLAR